MKRENKIGQLLLQSKAIILEPANPFTWASGWKSPIYCDNRKTLSFPEIRKTIKNEFVQLIKENFTEIDCIAGVATGAIAQGALVAEELGLPFVYIRSAAKGHGLENLIEGDIKEGMRIVVIEDLISTGGSSLKAVDALRKANTEVLGMCAIFSYGFSVAENNFKNSNCQLYTLTNYFSVLEIAVETNYIQKSDIEILKKWRESPENWNI